MRTNFSRSFDIALAVALGPSALYVAGIDGTITEADTLDSGYRIEAMSTDGVAAWGLTENPSVGQADGVMALAADATGVYVGTFEYVDGSIGDWRWRIDKRAPADGAVLWTQESNGSAEFDRPMAMAVDATGVYVAGQVEPNRQDLWRLEKRNLDDGGLIWTQDVDPTMVWDVPEAIAVREDAVYVVGSENGTPNANDSAMRVQRHDAATGAVMWSQTSNPTTFADSATSVAVDATGLYVVGYGSDTDGYIWRVEKRDLATGALLWEQTVRGGEPRAVVVGPDGLYVAGADSTMASVDLWRVEKRRLGDGALLWSDVLLPEVGGSVAYGIAIDIASNLYVVGTEQQFDRGLTSTSRGWRIEKRTGP